MPREMRRQHQLVIDPPTLTLWLQEATVGRLATVGEDGYPLITPVNFVYAEGKLYFHSATEGEKLGNLRRHPAVGFEVDRVLAVTPPIERGCQMHCMYHSVIVRGTARVLDHGTDRERKEWALRALITRYAPGTPDLTLQGVEQTAVVEITVEHITGKEDVGQRWSAAHKLEVARRLWQRDGEAAAEAIAALGVDVAAVQRTSE